MESVAQGVGSFLNFAGKVVHAFSQAVQGSARKRKRSRDESDKATGNGGSEENVRFQTGRTAPPSKRRRTVRGSSRGGLPPAPPVVPVRVTAVINKQNENPSNLARASGANGREPVDGASLEAEMRSFLGVSDGSQDNSSSASEPLLKKRNRLDSSTRNNIANLEREAPA